MEPTLEESEAISTRVNSVFLVYDVALRQHALRILQFLKQEADPDKNLQSKYLRSNLLYFSTIESEYSLKIKDLASSADLSSLSSLELIRDTLTNFEYSLRKQKTM